MAGLGQAMAGLGQAMAGLGQVAAYTRPGTTTDGQLWPAEAGQGRPPMAVEGRVGSKKSFGSSRGELSKINMFSAEVCTLTPANRTLSPQYTRGAPQPPRTSSSSVCSFWYPFSRIDRNPCDFSFPCVFGQFPRRRLSSRTRLVSFQGWTQPWTLGLGTPWVGPPGSVGHPGGPGSRGPFRPIGGPFRPVSGPFRPFFARFLRVLPSTDVLVSTRVL